MLTYEVNAFVEEVRDLKKSAARSVLSLAVLTLASAHAQVYAAVSFQQAVADYNAGKYSQANSEFEAYKQSYPNNALVHYYSALCKQALGQLEGAKSEYMWVTQNGDVRLKSLAQAGVANLSKVRSSTFSSAPVSSPSSSPAATSVVANAKVKKIIEFYADW